MKQTKSILLLFTALCAALIASSCTASRKTPAVPGHYTYQHGWDYPVKEGHLYVHETGTMDYRPDGSALDSANQVYRLVRPSGDTVCWVFCYVSPSRWRLDGDDFYFSGIEDRFRMTLLQQTYSGGCDSLWADKFAHRIIKNVGSTIGRETKFHVEHLTATEFVWSLTYSDGHTDHWHFLRQ